MLSSLSRPTIALLIAVVLAVLADFRVAVRGNTDIVSADAMKAARAHIEKIRKPGDIVVHSPLLSMKALAALGSMQASPALPVEELRKSRRIIKLDKAAQPMYGFSAPSSTHELSEGLIVTVHEPTADGPIALFDLVTDLERAKMRIERPAGTVKSNCTTPRSEGGRSCPGEAEWLYLARRELVVSNKSTQCIWAHPTTGGVIVVELPKLPSPAPGRKLVLELSAALTDDAANGTPGGASVLTTVRQGTKKKGQVNVTNRVGWFESKIDIEADLETELRVTTARDGRRHHCLKAKVKEAPK